MASRTVSSLLQETSSASADDLTSPPYRGKLTGQQIDWLQTFIVVWETVEYDVNQNSGNT